MYVHKSQKNELKTPNLNSYTTAGSLVLEIRWCWFYDHGCNRHISIFIKIFTQERKGFNIDSFKAMKQRSRKCRCLKPARATLFTKSCRNPSCATLHSHNSVRNEADHTHKIAWKELTRKPAGLNDQVFWSGRMFWFQNAHKLYWKNQIFQLSDLYPCFFFCFFRAFG